MTILNPDHLLQQAERLITAPRSRPARQADVRRAISASYSAIFHLVLAAATDTVVGRVHRGTPRCGRVYRSIEHKDLRVIFCDIARRPALPANYQSHVPTGAFGPAIQSFARVALWLQGQRHSADYDPEPRFHPSEASNAIEIARAAQTDWQTAPDEQKDALLWLLLFRPHP